MDTACVRAIRRLEAAADREAWDEVEQLFAPVVSVESRRKIVGFTRIDLQSRKWPHEMRRYLESGMVRHRHAFVAERGERLALVRLEVGTEDESPDAPRVEVLRLFGLDEEGRIALQVAFDIEDIDAAIAELDAAHARLKEEQPQAHRLENAATRVYEHVQECFAARELDAMANRLADDFCADDRRRVVGAGVQHGRDAAIEDARANASLSVRNSASSVIATRGQRLALRRSILRQRPATCGFPRQYLEVVEIDADERLAAVVTFDPDDFDAAFEELDARYLVGEAAAHAHTWSVIAGTYAEFNRHEHDPSSVVNIDHRRVARFAPGDLTPANTKDLMPNLRAHVESVHRLGNIGAVVTCTSYATTQDGFEAEWRTVLLQTVDDDLMSRNEMFDEADLDAAIARFDELSRPAPQLENAAIRADARFNALFAERRWDDIGTMITDDIRAEDRRRGLRREDIGRITELAELRAIADLGVKKHDVQRHCDPRGTPRPGSHPGRDQRGLPR